MLQTIHAFPKNQTLWSSLGIKPLHDSQELAVIAGLYGLELRKLPDNTTT